MDCVSCLLHRDYPLVLLAGLKGYGNCSDEYVPCGRHCINFVHIRISRNGQYFNTVSTLCRITINSLGVLLLIGDCCGLYFNNIYLYKKT